MQREKNTDELIERLMQWRDLATQLAEELTYELANKEKDNLQSLLLAQVEEMQRQDRREAMEAAILATVKPEPCIPAWTLRGMVERIYLRLRVERDDRMEAFEL
jgi:hypothetical protein